MESHIIQRRRVHMMSVQCRLDVTPSKSVREKVFVRREMQMTNDD